jgi:hypothetical protein
MRLLFHSAPLPPERPLSCLARFGLLIAPYKRSKRRLSDTIRTMEWPPLIPFEIHPVKRALAEIKKAFEFKKAGDMNRFDSWHSYSLLEINRLSAEHGEQLLEGLARQGLTVVYQPLALDCAVDTVQIFDNARDAEEAFLRTESMLLAQREAPLVPPTLLRYRTDGFWSSVVFCFCRLLAWKHRALSLYYAPDAPGGKRLRLEFEAEFASATLPLAGEP